MTHFLDAQGNVPKQLSSRRLVQYLGAIVGSVTTEPVQSLCPVDLKCRRRPGKKPCRGTILAAFEADTNNVTWHCSSCGDSGLIHHWQRTLWDKGGRPELPNITRVTYRHGLVDDDDLEGLTGLESVLLEGNAISREIVAAIYDNQFLGAEDDYGDLLVVAPLESDELTIEHAGGHNQNLGCYPAASWLVTSRTGSKLPSHQPG